MTINNLSERSLIAIFGNPHTKLIEEKIIPPLRCCSIGDIPGELSCHPDGDDFYHHRISKDNPIILRAGDAGLVILYGRDFPRA